MEIVIKWKGVRANSDPKWKYSRVLYAYIAPHTNEILYIGKAGKLSVRRRWCRSGKVKFWDALEKERRIFKHATIVGDIYMDEGSRFSQQILSDIESLLIKRIKPWGNDKSRYTRISRPGMRVKCEGAWPIEKKEFWDR